MKIYKLAVLMFEARRHPLTYIRNCLKYHKKLTVSQIIDCEYNAMLNCKRGTY